MSNSHRISRSSLKNMIEDEVAPDIVDPRAHMLTERVIVDTNVMNAIQDIFAGTSVATSDEKISKILAVRAEVNQNWSQARDSFLAIGRALLDLETVLSKSEYVKLRQGSERLFPFSDATATQLRRIAKAVEEGVIPRDLCPGSYGTAYQITLLNERQLQLAKERGLIRPDVTRREIASLRKETVFLPEQTGRVNIEALKEEYKRLMRQKQKLEDELATINNRASEIEENLGRLVH